MPSMIRLKSKLPDNSALDRVNRAEFKLYENLFYSSSIEDFLSLLNKEINRRTKIRALVLYHLSVYLGHIQYVCYSKGTFKHRANEYKAEETEDKLYLAHSLGRPVHHILRFSIPLREKSKPAFLFIELNQTGFEKGAALGDSPSYRIDKKHENANKTSINPKPVDKVAGFYRSFSPWIESGIDRLLHQEHLQSSIHLWTASFNSLKDPLAIFDDQNPTGRKPTERVPLSSIDGNSVLNPPCGRKPTERVPLSSIDGNSVLNPPCGRKPTERVPLSSIDCPSVLSSKGSAGEVFPTSKVNKKQKNSNKNITVANTPFHSLFKDKQETALQQNSFEWKGRYFEKHSYPVNIKEDRYIIYHYIDITESLNLRNKMIQNIRLSALGQLGANVAHQLNNPLTGVLSMAQLLLKEGHLSPEEQKDMQDIIEGISRSQEIIANLLNFSRLDSSLTLCDLNTVVKKTLPFLKSLICWKNLKLELSPAPVLVKAQFCLLQQVVFNLLKNACQAVEPVQRSSVRSVLRLSFKTSRHFYM